MTNLAYALRLTHGLAFIAAVTLAAVAPLVWSGGPGF